MSASKPHSTLEQARARVAQIDRYASDPKLREDGRLLADLVEQLESARSETEILADLLELRGDEPYVRGQVISRLHELVR